MSERYKFGEPDQLHFVTLTVVDWVDLFTFNEYKDVLLDSLRFCQKEKGLIIYSWVIMTNHLHLIISSKGAALGDIIRDFKRHTNKTLIRQIKDGFDPRRDWMLERFSKAIIGLKRFEKYKIWIDGVHPVILETDKMIEQRHQYIINNPVKKGYVYEPEQYPYSSAIDYVGGQGFLDIELLDL
jgi:putative transposase